MTPNLCTISNLTIRAGDRQLLAGLDLEIEVTGLYAIMGPDGVGKSTLLAVFDGHGDSNGFSISYDVARFADRELDQSNHPIVIEQANRSEQTRFFADWLVLLGGGRIVEQGLTAAFFDKPSNPVSKHFIIIGSRSLPRLHVHPRQLAPKHRGLPDWINVMTVGAADGIQNCIIRRMFAIALVEGETSFGRKTDCYLAGLVH